MPDLDIETKAAIIDALGVDETHLANAKVYGRVKAVVDYYLHRPNARMEVLQLVAKQPGKGLDTVWNYVQIQREKSYLLAQMLPEDFEPDVAAEIVAGHLTTQKKELIRVDIAKQKQLPPNPPAEGLSLSPGKLELYDKLLNRLDSFDKELALYG